jgi:hypothetical protein
MRAFKMGRELARRKRQCPEPCLDEDSILRAADAFEQDLGFWLQPNGPNLHERPPFREEFCVDRPCIGQSPR